MSRCSDLDKARRRGRVITAIGVAVFSIALSCVQVQAKELPGPLAKGTQTAIQACDAAKLRYFFDGEGVHPDDIIGHDSDRYYSGGTKKGPTTVFRRTIERVGKVRPNWGMRPRTDEKAGKSANYIEDAFGHFRSKKMLARIAPCMDTVKLAIEYGASMDGPGFSESPVIVFAFATRWPDLMILLKDSGADPYAVFANGTNLLHMLARRHPMEWQGAKCRSSSCTSRILESEIFEWLMADVTSEHMNVQDKFGGTPLIYKLRGINGAAPDDAVLAHLDVWLKAGPNLCLKDKNGLTAADYALERGLLKVRKALACQS